MLEIVRKYAVQGLTIIEDDYAAVGPVLARQLASGVRVSGGRVAVVSLAKDERQGPVRDLAARMEAAVGSRTSESGRSAPGDSRREEVLILERENYDLLIVEGLSSYLLEKTEHDAIELISTMSRLGKNGKGFFVTCEPTLLRESMMAFLRATADSVIAVNTEIVGDRVNRMLYVPKLREYVPFDRLIKITVDDRGVHEDTRELVG